MFNLLFKGLFDSDWMSVISLSDFILCICFSLLLGIIISLCYMYKSSYSQSYIVTLAMLPTIVCVVIMMVNGNIGASVAVAGSFSLLRFRSVAGSAKEITAIFLAMGAGLISGMGYLGFSFLFTVILSCSLMLLNGTNYGINKHALSTKTIRITIPEDLDYTGVFDEIFKEYLETYELVSVKTTNMGSLFRLTYIGELKDISKEKEMIDKLRIRNGNLEISVLKQEMTNTDL